MESKKNYIKPVISISEFSVKDIIRASVVPCPTGYEPCDPDTTCPKNEDSFSCIDSFSSCTIVA